MSLEAPKSDCLDDWTFWWALFFRPQQHTRTQAIRAAHKGVDGDIAPLIILPHTLYSSWIALQSTLFLIVKIYV